MQNKELGSGRRQLKGFKIGEMRGSFDRHIFLDITIVWRNKDVPLVIII